jgi:hypothetical protein
VVASRGRRFGSRRLRLEEEPDRQPAVPRVDHDAQQDAAVQASDDGLALWGNGGWTPQMILRLQSTAGNAAVTGLLAGLSGAADAQTDVGRLLREPAHRSHRRNAATWSGRTWGEHE